jgi:methionyl-tRNA formyltransferase
VFLGTPVEAVVSLRALHSAGFDVALVVTRPDRRRGRGGALSPSPVKAAAADLGLPVTHRVEDALAVGADLGVVVAFGALIKAPVLAALAFVNVHFSLLPRWRGAAPVERAILAGDDVTGVALMRVEEGLDTGPVLATARVPIDAATTAADLRATLAARGATLLVESLGAGLGEPVPQAGEATYAAKVDPSELRLDWPRPAAELDRIVRVGGAWTTFRGHRLKVLDAFAADGSLPPGRLAGDAVGTGAGVLVLRTVQAEGRGPLAAEAWRLGARPTPGECLGT